jgi:hypothetical protein
MSVIEIRNIDELIDHLRGLHKSTCEEISEWTADYCTQYPDMDVREHIWHLHDVQHESDEITPHTHAASKED